MAPERQWFSNNQAAVLIAILVALQVLSVAYIIGFTANATTGYAVGQVLSNVQNEPPSNYYFNADAAAEVFEGKPAFRLSIGQNVVMNGKASDLNGYGELGASTCAWTATAFSSTTAISFNTCNSTDCNYTCSLTLSSSTPAGTYNVTSTIIDTSGASSVLSQLIYVFGFGGSTQVGGSRGRDVLILRPAPSVTPSPTAAPAKATPVASPTLIPPSRGEFGLAIAASDFINKCEVRDAEVIVENNNPSQKSLVLEFEGKSLEMDLQPFEVRSVFFKIKAPKAKGEMTFLMQASLYQNGVKIAEKQKAIKLLWKGLDICVTQTPTREFNFIAGRAGVAKVGLEVATDYSPSTLEIEALKEESESHVFLDLEDTTDGYYASSFDVFESGAYDFKARVRKGFEVLEEKFEKEQIG